MHIGGRVRLTEEGRLCVAERPELLAGSAQMLPWGIGKLVGSGIADLRTAWDMASVRPARFIGTSGSGGLKPGAAADLVLFDIHGRDISILRTVKDGKTVYAV
ncbi:amidohydrolase family protein [Paenibacillus sp. DMB20]|uniref:amidohydrolase family protein n=1 Tax=Paenibacillus sp. DMB20 TaxID=1642570 RepID=UPI001F46B02B|nr:amidohydrolase family protein [Paenibacillus sp. DMB20]